MKGARGYKALNSGPWIIHIIIFVRYPVNNIYYILISKSNKKKNTDNLFTCTTATETGNICLATPRTTVNKETGFRLFWVSRITIAINITNTRALWHSSNYFDIGRYPTGISLIVIHLLSGRVVLTIEYNKRGVYTHISLQSSTVQYRCRHRWYHTVI